MGEMKNKEFHPDCCVFEVCAFEDSWDACCEAALRAASACFSWRCFSSANVMATVSASKEHSVSQHTWTQLVFCLLTFYFLNLREGNESRGTGLN